jgi:DNA mismatch repair protein MutL
MTQRGLTSIGKIHRLDETTINKIAAGEIVERPASVIKELVENSIDAGATRIEIEIRNGGRQLIKIVDNGCGMEQEDAILAIERHSTSKISASEDLWSLCTLGFRGEALPSVASVSRFELITKPLSQQLGTYLEIEAGLLKKVKQVGAPDGTTIMVHDLFYNTPARLKYLRTIPTETGYISEIVARLALGYPGISFRLQHHQYELLFTPGNGNPEETIVAVFGKEIAREMIAINHEENGLKIHGYYGKPSIARNNRNYEIFYINGRYFHSRTLSAAVEKAFHTLLPIARYPFVIMFVEIDPALVDVNVHPSKHEVRFARESEIFKPVYHSIHNSLKYNSFIADWVTPDFGANLKLSTPSGTPRLPASQTMQSVPLRYTEFMENKTDLSTVSEAQPALSGEAQVSAAPAQEIPADCSPALPGVTETGEQNRSELPETIRIYPNPFLNTYIIACDQKGLLFIDQHAAHERILYEKYLNRAKTELGTQSLLIPPTLNLNLSQYKLVAERLTFFREIGFDLETFGGKTIIVRGVPLTLLNYDYEQIILELIEQYMNFKSFKNPAEIKEAFLITMSCRTAVKAGDKLKVEEISNLVNELFKCDNPYTCPHGRPTIFRMSTEELTKKFLRR